MKAETLIVAAHGGASDIVEMNLPNWQEFFRDIIIVSPTDDPLPNTQTFGQSGHHGPDSMERTLNLLKLAAQHDACCCMEADIIFFGNPEVQDGEVLVSEIHRNFDPAFLADRYPHPPVWGTRKSFEALIDALPFFDEQGMGDRVFGAALPWLGIEMRAVGFSRNSIDTPKFLDEALLAVDAGALCVHGVKTREVHNALLKKAPVLPLGY